MNRLELLKVLMPRLLPTVREMGFERQGKACFYRDRDGYVDVIELVFHLKEEHRQMGTTKLSYSLEGGVWLELAPNPDNGAVARDAGGRPAPICAECFVRSTVPSDLQKTIFGPRGIWYVREDARNLDELATRTARRIKRSLAAFFDRVSDDEKLLEVLFSAGEVHGRYPTFWGFGRVGSPMRTYLIGVVAAKIGKKDLAHRHLSAMRDAGQLEMLHSDPAKKWVENYLTRNS